MYPWKDPQYLPYQTNLILPKEKTTSRRKLGEQDERKWKILQGRSDP